LDQHGHEVVHTKGSADVLLPLCSSQQLGEDVAPLDEEGRQAILHEAERMSSDALRVLAVAHRRLGADSGREGAGARPIGDIEQRLTFVGLVGMIDPPRVGAKEAVRACAEAQVRAVMITGDHKLTAIAIAKELGLWEPGALALTGVEMDRLGEEALARDIA